MANLPTLKVNGLKELRSELRKLDLQKDLQKTNKRAAEFLVPKAKAKASGLGFPRPGSKVIGSIRATATQKSAFVNIGKKSVPHGPGHEVGSRRYAQFRPSRPKGYIIGPTVEENKDEILKIYGDDIDDLTKRAFPD